MIIKSKELKTRQDMKLFIIFYFIFSRLKKLTNKSLDATVPAKHSDEFPFSAAYKMRDKIRSVSRMSMIEKAKIKQKKWMIKM